MILICLLNEAWENTEVLIDALHTPSAKKPRIYRKRAHKGFLALVRSRKSSKKVLKAIGQQMRYLNRNLKSINAMLLAGDVLTPRQASRLGAIRKVYEQQKTMYDTRNHKISDRIVSLSPPWLRPIVRGKGHGGGGVRGKAGHQCGQRLEVCSFDAYHEAGGLPNMLERYKERNIRLSGPDLGRPKKMPSPINGRITLANVNVWKWIDAAVLT